MSETKDKHSIADKLLKKQEITRESLIALIQVAERNNLEIPWWEKFGQPAFDRLSAVLEGPADVTGTAVQQIMGLEGLRCQFRIFPRGIILADRVAIEIEAFGAA